MLEVCAFCLYRRRTEPQCFVPDPSSFPPYHQRLKPHIFSEAEVARLLSAAAGLKRNPLSPLRPEAIRLAIILLFTTGIRRGELLRLTLGDYDRGESTLLIRKTKFYKSRLLPINDGIADEVDRYLRARAQHKLPVSSDTALLWNAFRGDGRTAAQACNSVFDLCFRTAASLHQKADCRGFTIFGIASPSMPCCDGTGLTPMSRRSCHCWQPTWGMVRQYRRITTGTLSSHSAQQPANGSPITTVNWSPHCRNQQGGADENRTSEPTRRRNPRLLHGSPSPPSRNQSAHRPQLPRQHCSAAAASLPRAE
jgi:integrase